MKKQYICPTLECVAVHYRYSLCSGSDITDDINGNGPDGGSQGGSRAPRRPKF